jgi:ABC-type sugar transport system ATPase subunit
MRSELKALHDKTKASFVYVTHDQVEAMTMGTQIAVLNGGVIQQIGSPSDIYHEPANVFVASFMGSPPMNIIPGTFMRDEIGAYVEIPGDHSNLLRTPTYDLCELNSGDSVLLGIRPEHFTLEPNDNPIIMVPQQSESTGADQFVRFAVQDDCSVSIRLTDAPAIQPGVPLTLYVKPNRMTLFNPKTEQAIPKNCSTGA